MIDDNESKRSLKPNSLFGSINKKMLKPNPIFNTVGKRSLRPNTMFNTMGGKRSLKPNSLFGAFGKKNSLFSTMRSIFPYFLIYGEDEEADYDIEEDEDEEDEGSEDEEMFKRSNDPYFWAVRGKRDVGDFFATRLHSNQSNVYSVS